MCCKSCRLVSSAHIPSTLVSSRPTVLEEQVQLTSTQVKSKCKYTSRPAVATRKYKWHTSSMADRLQLTSWPFWFTNVFMAWHRHTSLTNFTIQQNRSFEGVCVPHRLMNCLFPVPDSQPTATELYQSSLYESGTVFRSISHLLRHFPFLANRLSI